MADGLSIITGISMLSFLLFYLAFQIDDKRSKVFFGLKVFLIIFSLFILSYIPATIISMDRDCAVLTDGTYKCFMSNGTAVTDFGQATTQVGSGLSVVYMNFLYFIVAFVFLFIMWKGVIAMISWWKGRGRYV